MNKTSVTEITNLDWFITRICDQARHCRFCYAPWNAFGPDASLNEALQICDRIAELGVRCVTLCGGEPTLYPYLVPVLRALNEKGITIVLYSSLTNDFDFSAVLNYVPIFSIPVDAITPSVVQGMRGVHQFEGVLRFLRWIRSLETWPAIKVGTVLTRKNKGELKNILHFLERWEVVDVWRIYQFSPYGIGKKNEMQFLISNEEFYNAVTQAMN